MKLGLGIIRDDPFGGVAAESIWYICWHRRFYSVDQPAQFCSQLVVGNGVWSYAQRQAEHRLTGVHPGSLRGLVDNIDSHKFAPSSQKLIGDRAWDIIGHFTVINPSDRQDAVWSAGEERFVCRV